MSVEIIPGIYEEQNLEQRANLVFVNDWSGSMAQFKLAHDAALEQMLDELAEIPILRQGLELAICDFSTDVQLQDFAPVPFVKDLRKPFSGGLSTSLGEAIDVTIDQTMRRRQMLADDGIPVIRSVVVVLSDGEATDYSKLQSVVPKIERVVQSEEIVFIPLILRGMHSGPLKAIFNVKPIRVENVNFSLLFAALWRSMSTASQRGPNSTESIYDTFGIEYQQQLALEHKKEEEA